METNQNLQHLLLPECDDSAIWEIFLSAYRYPALIAADSLGLFACLEDQALPMEAIQKLLGLGPRATEALVATLSSMNLLVEEAECFALSRIAKTYLLPNGAFYWGHMFHFDHDKPVTGENLIEALRRESPRPYSNADLWSDHELNVEHALKFTRAMHSHSFPSAVSLAKKDFFSQVSRLLDVAGGSGCFSIALALRWPRLQCTVAERPFVCAAAKTYIDAFGVSERVGTANLDMFSEPWPRGFDAVLLSNVLHDWNAEQCLQLLRSAFTSLPADGTLFIHEMLLNERKSGPWPVAAFSLTMLRFTEGKQLTPSELREMLFNSGFKSVEWVQASGFYSLVVAKK